MTILLPITHKMDTLDVTHSHDEMLYRDELGPHTMTGINLTNIKECTCVLRGFSRVQLFARLWRVACQAPLSIGFSRQDYWSGLPCPRAHVFLSSPALVGGFFTISATWEVPVKRIHPRNSLVVQWLGLSTFTAEDAGSVPGWRTKILPHVKSFSRVQLFVTLWTIACQAPPSMGFSRKEYWSGLPFPSPGGLFSTQGSNPGFPHCRETLHPLSYQGIPHGCS